MSPVGLSAEPHWYRWDTVRCFSVHLPVHGQFFGGGEGVTAG